jgi:predicted RNase H-like HicB family nuclease
MEFPVIIHKDANSVYGVTVPDVAGCHSFGETIEEALRNTKEAIHSHIEVLLEEGETVDLAPSNIDDLIGNDDYAGGIWALVDVDLTKLDTKPERINISIPRFVLQKVDSFAESRHESRSGLLARAALRLIAEETKEASIG